jgi:hypothetical protein
MGGIQFVVDAKGQKTAGWGHPIDIRPIHDDETVMNGPPASAGGRAVAISRRASSASSVLRATKKFVEERVGSLEGRCPEAFDGYAHVQQTAFVCG